MKELLKQSILTCLTLSLVGCGGSDSPSTEQSNASAIFSLGLSDAPVDDAEAVYIELDSIKLTNTDQSQGKQETVIEKFTDTTTGVEVETVQVNLLDFQGSSQIKIVDETQNIELVNGTYEMELTVIDAGSYVLLDNDATQHAIKVPSSRLRLGEFTVNDEAVQVNDTPAYTVEFDLRQSLVLRGNINNNNGFIIKPHGVRIVSLSGSIEGSVSTNFTNLGECTVYLYGADVIEYGDIFDINDENFVAPQQVITASAPLATTKVSVDGTYSIGFVQTGSYQAALTCGTDIDDNIQFDELTIPSAADITP
ncbi:MAG: DUF4382 domain-containing protein, partial [Colwellia sp.]|nr:DUF4382 domain-containing protein [Colwellia sp.]